MKIPNDEVKAERRNGRFASIDGAFLRERLVKRAAAAPKKKSVDRSFCDLIPRETDDQPDLSRKIAQCTVLHNFDSKDDASEREQKTRLLNELIDLLDTPSGQTTIISGEMIPFVLRMVTANMFRPFRFVSKPASVSTSLYEADEEETLLESAWPHLQLVYQFFLRLLILPQFSPILAAKYCDGSFIKQVSDSIL